MVAPTPKKKKIDAKQFAQDIEAGMHESALMAAYGLSSTELQRAMKKLEDRGLLKHSRPAEPDPNTEMTGPVQSRPRQAKPRQEVFECPACGWTHTEPFEECGHCGIVLSKFLEHGHGEGGAGTWDDAHTPSRLSYEPAVKETKHLATMIGIGVIVLILICGYMVHRSWKRAEIQALMQNVQSALNASNAQRAPDYSHLARVFGDSTGAMAAVMESRRTPYSEKMHELYQKMVYLGELQKRAEWRGSGSVKGMAAYRNAARGARAQTGAVRNELENLAERLDAQRGALSGASDESGMPGEAEAQGVIPDSSSAPASEPESDPTAKQFEKAQDELRSLCTEVLNILATQ